MNNQLNIVQKFFDFLQREDQIIVLSTILSLSFVVFLSIIYLINIDFLPNQLPLFYSLPWGEKQLIQKSQFIILPSVIILVLLTNLVISWHLHRSQTLIKRILSVSSVVIGLLILITGIKIIYTFI